MGILLAQLRSIGLLQHINKHPICTYTGECLSLVGFRSHLMVTCWTGVFTVPNFYASPFGPKTSTNSALLATLLHAHPRDLLAFWPGHGVSPHLSHLSTAFQSRRSSAPVFFLGLQALIGEKVRIEGLVVVLHVQVFHRRRGPAAIC